MPTKSALLYDAMAMNQQAQNALSASLSQRYQDAYQDTIQQQLDRLGERLSAKRATGSELSALERMASNDAASIASTYNSDLERRIMQLPPDADLATAKAELRQWQQERSRWKDEQISRSTQGHAADYATDLFISRNKLSAARVIWYAVPPIVANSHPTCIQRVSAGAVPFTETRDWDRPHPNCRHRKQTLLQEAGTITGKVWRG